MGKEYTPFKMKGSPMQRNFGIGKAPLKVAGAFIDGERVAYEEAKEAEGKEGVTVAFTNKEAKRKAAEDLKKAKREEDTAWHQDTEDKGQKSFETDMAEKEVKRTSKRTEEQSAKGHDVTVEEHQRLKELDRIAQKKTEGKDLGPKEQAKLREAEAKKIDLSKRETTKKGETVAKTTHSGGGAPLTDYKKGYYGAKKKSPMKADVKDIGGRTQPVVPKYREGEYDVKRKGGKLSEATKKKLKVKGKARVITAGKLPVKKKEGGARGK